MKSIELWYRKLPSHIRDKAIYNREKQLDNIHIAPIIKKRGSKVHTLWEAVNAGFKWNVTPEGYDYWKVIKRNLQYLEGQEIINKDTLAIIDRENPNVNYEGSMFG